MIFEERLVFFPAAYPSGPYADAVTMPGLRDESFTTSDGVRLHGWYIPAESSKVLILYSHGNGGNLSYGAGLYRRLQQEGYSLFAYDYRGYGRSEGSPTEDGVYLDAQAAYDHARQISGLSSERIILWGTSMGGAVTVNLATQRASAGLILESTFSSARDVAAYAYPFLPTRILMRTRFDSEQLLPTIGRPTLHIHGEHDELIPIALGRKLYDANSGIKEWFVVPGAGHNDVYDVGGMEYLRTIRSFIQRNISSE